MGVNESIDGLANAVITVQRFAKGTYNSAGVYVPNAPTTFTCSAVVQPAFNLNRIIGGANLASNVDLQRVEKIYQVHTTVELKGRTPNTDPDVVTYDGEDYTYVRVEGWDITGEKHYHGVITKQTQGAS